MGSSGNILVKVRNEKISINIVIDGIRLTLYPDQGSCNMDDIVYIAYCMVEGCDDFYIGHTICRLRDRCSGHRGSFKGEGGGPLGSNHGK